MPAFVIQLLYCLCDLGAGAALDRQPSIVAIVVSRRTNQLKSCQDGNKPSSCTKTASEDHLITANASTQQKMKRLGLAALIDAVSGPRPAWQLHHSSCSQPKKHPPSSLRHDQSRPVRVPEIVDEYFLANKVCKMRLQIQPAGFHSHTLCTPRRVAGAASRLAIVRHGSLQGFLLPF